MTDIRSTVLDLIREVDPGNTLDSGTLGAVLGQRLAPHFTDLYAAEVQKFVAARGYLTAVDLADAVVREFRLNEEI
jgi:hypothetical protein